MAAGAGMQSMMQVSNAERQADAIAAEGAAAAQSTMAQGAASAIGSLGSVFGNMGGGGGYSSGSLSFSKAAGAQAQSEFGSFLRSQ